MRYPENEPYKAPEHQNQTMSKLPHIFGIVGIAVGLFAFLAPRHFFRLLTEYTGQPNAQHIRSGET